MNPSAILRRLLTFVLVVVLTEGIILQYYSLPVEAAPSIDVVAPSGFEFDHFAVGMNSGESMDGTVSVTEALAWHVTATDLTNSGFMKNGGTSLENKLTMCETAGGTFVNANTNLIYSSSPTTLSIYAKQQVTSNDPAGTYAITITFTGSIDD